MKKYKKSLELDSFFLINQKHNNCYLNYIKKEFLFYLDNKSSSNIIQSLK